MESFTVPRGFFESKAWQNQRTIRQFLVEPNTFIETSRHLGQERHLKNPRPSALYALKELIRRGEVVGEITAETLKKTEGKLTPMYRATRKLTVFHGGASKNSPIDGTDYSIMRLYKDKNGNVIAKQYFKKVKAKLAKGDTKRAITPIIALDETGRPCAKFRNWRSFWNWKRTSRQSG